MHNYYCHNNIPLIARLGNPHNNIVIFLIARLGNPHNNIVISLSLLPDLGTPSLGIGSTLAVHIQPSDDAFGRFDFRTDSQARVVAEQQGGTPVTLTVVREGGVFGVVSLYWSVSQSQGSEVTDITPTEGTLVFNEGEPEAVIQLLVRDDLVSVLTTILRSVHNIIDLSLVCVFMTVSLPSVCFHDRLFLLVCVVHDRLSPSVCCS